ncbi:hypothetical protein BD310DRAFT_50848 [Dichomitus squalens]|uniref:Uncharacterized protein n=1 Tax=Dichomitus squalens TaxID=114155 RepID=A0A4Q9Q604_9APHY|nr:hypothetical protein BD310DRAFT_50848 [Dichomitus squalens]
MKTVNHPDAEGMRAAERPYGVSVPFRGGNGISAYPPHASETHAIATTPSKGEIGSPIVRHLFDRASNANSHQTKV